MTRGFTSIILAFAIGLPAAGWASNGSLGAPTDIQEVHEKAESGDLVIVEGVIVELTSGSGSYRLATIEDDTGRVVIALPEHLRRTIERTPGETVMYKRVRATGKWDHPALDKSVWGVRVSAIERIEE